MNADFLLLPIPLLRRISDGTGAMSLPLSHCQGRWSHSHVERSSPTRHTRGQHGPSYSPTLCFPVARSTNIHWCNYFDFKFRNSLYKNTAHCNLSPGYDYKRRGFSPFRRLSSKQGETLQEAPVEQDAREPLFSSPRCFPGWGVEIRPTSENLGLSPDENILWQAKWEHEFHNRIPFGLSEDILIWQAKWEHEFHNRIQQTRLGADVRTIQEGFGSFCDAVKWELAGWLDTANDTYHPNGI